MFIIGNQPPARGQALGTELWMEVHEDDGTVYVTEHRGWVIVDESRFSGTNRADRARLVITDFESRLAASMAAVDDGYAILLRNLQMAQDFFTDAAEEDPQERQSADAIGDAIEMIRTHALPADHPLAIN